LQSLPFLELAANATIRENTTDRQMRVEVSTETDSFAFQFLSRNTRAVRNGFWRQHRNKLVRITSVRPPLKGPFRKQIVVDLHQMKSMSDDFVEASKLAQSEQGRYSLNFEFRPGMLAVRGRSKPKFPMARKVSTTDRSAQ